MMRNLGVTLRFRRPTEFSWKITANLTWNHFDISYQFWTLERDYWFWVMQWNQLSLHPQYPMILFKDSPWHACLLLVHGVGWNIPRFQLCDQRPQFIDGLSLTIRKDGQGRTKSWSPVSLLILLLIHFPTISPHRLEKVESPSKKQ